MYYIAKSLEFLGLLIILIGFIWKVPELMNPYVFMYGLVLFIIGWIIEKYILK